MSRRLPDPKVSPKARKLVRTFENRVEDYAFMGSQRPDDWPAIERGYHRALYHLLDYIEDLENRPTKPVVRLPQHSDD